MEFMLCSHQGKLQHNSLIVLIFSLLILLLKHCSDVANAGFCSSYCGWHTYRGNYKYAWIGIPPTGCNCFSQSTSANGNAAVDSAVTSMAHEIIETVTDPNINAWFNSNGDENGDVCAWNFLNRTWIYDNTTNSYYSFNLVVGGLKYLVQANYNLNTQNCTMS